MKDMKVSQARAFVRLSSRELSWNNSRCRWMVRSIEADSISGLLANVESCSLISSSYLVALTTTQSCEYRFVPLTRGRPILAPSPSNGCLNLKLQHPVPVVQE